MNEEDLMHDAQGNQCPSCHAQIANTVCQNHLGEPPRMGDPSICFVCGLLLVFNESGKLRPMADDILKAYAPATQRALLNYQKTIQERNKSIAGNN